MNDALAFAAARHRGQVRRYTGEAFIEHPVRVALHVFAAAADETATAAALLHDVLEDTATTADEIAGRFGEDVQRLVCAVTAPAGPASRQHRLSRLLEQLRQGDGRAHSIKAADILDNVPSIVAFDAEFARRVYLREKARTLKALTRAEPALWKRAVAVVDACAERLGVPDARIRV